MATNRPGNANPRFGFIPVCSVLGNEDEVNRTVADYSSTFAEIGGERWRPEHAGRRAPLLIFVVTGGTERQILDLWEKRGTVADREPVFLVAHPGHNSLPASLEVLARLQQEGAPGRILYLGGPQDVTSVGQLVRAVHDLETYHLLRRARVGLVGRPSDWLIASSPSPATVRQAWGPEVESISFQTLTEEMETVSSKEACAFAEELANSAQQVQEPNRAELEDGARVYLGLRRLVTRYRLSALALRCFDLVVRVRTTGCFALAQLNDEGIIASCEGDIVSTVGMLWAFYLLGQIPWMANPARLNEVDNTLWLAHCTVPRCLTRRYRLRSHFESGLGVALQGEMLPGPVTVLRIGGAELDRIWLAEGELLHSGDAEDLCRTQAEIRLTRGAVSDLLRTPLGNHLVSVQGHHADRLRSWWEAMIGPSE